MKTKYLAPLLLVLFFLSACKLAAPLPPVTSASASPSSSSTNTQTPTAAPILTATPRPRCAFPGSAGTTGRRDLPHAGDAWQLSTPEAQGMDAQLLSGGLAALDDSHGIHSFLIARHGFLVIEQYYNGSSGEYSYQIASITKSVISALTGIAIREGFIADTRQYVSEFLPEYFTSEANQPKSEITLQDFLIMSAGFALPEIGSQSDWIQATIDAPLVTAPGKYFWYNSALPHVISSIISKVSGMDTCEFAYQYLFEPMDITLEYWDRDPQHFFNGAAGMYLTPREMAEFGQLYLNRGQWNGTQVLPAAWVDESFQAYVHVPHQSEVDPDADWWLAAEVTGYDDEFDYGYYWWINSIDGHTIYTAIGWGGQKIHVIPDLDMVIVTTSDPRQSNQIIDSFGWIENYVIPAIAP